MFGGVFFFFKYCQSWAKVSVDFSCLAHSERDGGLTSIAPYQGTGYGGWLNLSGLEVRISYINIAHSSDPHPLAASNTTPGGNARVV